MAAHVDWTSKIFGQETHDGSSKKQQRSRPMPLRLRTFSVAGFRSPGFNENRAGVHARNKSLSLIAEVAEMNSNQRQEDHTDTDDTDIDSARTSLDDSLSGSTQTPLTTISSQRSSLEADGPQVIPYDFSRIDYELERAKALGEGLWSKVFLAEQRRSQSERFGAVYSTSPKTSRFTRRARYGSTPSLFAVKLPARRDAKEIFYQEGRVLTHLQRRSTSEQFVVPFWGLDERNGALVFEAVIGGSLENLSSRLKQMTEVARHLELINIFPGIAYDLINGLEFLHSNGVVHADIKPGNILLDVSEHATNQQPVVRARFIDFSASFMPDKGDSASNAGGTWDYMAPEQMRIQKDLNTPTTASDVWSLGVTLLYILVGDSPYAAACNGNMFMLREAIKSGDPLQFARMDPIPQKRLAACQDFVDICRQALKKDRDNRTTAGAWATWLEEFGS